MKGGIGAVRRLGSNRNIIHLCFYRAGLCWSVLSFGAGKRLVRPTVSSISISSRSRLRRIRCLLRFEFWVRRCDNKQALIMMHGEGTKAST